ncbi:ribonuclease III [Patescibacteria group bacterium]
MNIPIKNKSLLETALTHRSYLNENRSVKEHNERLEYLGDAVVELAVSEFLFEKYPKRPEGELTAIRSAMVRTETLAKVAERLDFGLSLRMSKGEAASGGRSNTALLANTFEAVIGAMYLDQGFQKVIDFLKENLFPEADEIVENGSFKDFKSTLQEVVQAEGKSTPEYQVVSEKGPDHDKIFTVMVKVEKQELATGKGKSKQSAQQQAAARALEKLKVS